MPKDSKIMIRMSTSEKARLDDLAMKEGIPTATWVRRELMRNARASTLKESPGQGYKATATGPLSLLSLFCGPGGLDEGFRQAGFKTLLATDVDKDCVSTFASNHTGVKVFQADITKLTLEQLDEAYGGEVSPVGVIGGPPCQSFSVSNIHQSDNDPRHKLSEAYAVLLGKLNKRNPLSFFVFENVPGLLGEKHRHRYERFKGMFREAGFEIFEQILDAKNYGVPQERTRIIIVGINQKKHPGKTWEPPSPENKIKTVRDVLYGIPEPVLNARGLDPDNFPVHPNHWCLVPRSGKFNNGKLQEGVIFGRSFRTLRWDKPSWTVAYGHREVHVHPQGHRRLSLYEALLLQTFPETYRLKGNMSAQIRLVSEAVPPRLARYIAKSIRKSLDF